MPRNTYAPMPPSGKRRSTTASAVVTAAASLLRISLISASLIPLCSVTANAQPSTYTIPVGGNAVFDVAGSGYSGTGFIGSTNYHNGDTSYVYTSWPTYLTSTTQPVTSGYKPFGISNYVVGSLNSHLESADLEDRTEVYQGVYSGPYATVSGRSGGTNPVVGSGSSQGTNRQYTEGCWRIYQIGAGGSQTLVAQHSDKGYSNYYGEGYNNPAGWGVRPLFARDNHSLFEADGMIKKLAVFVPSTATAGSYVAHFTEYGDRAYPGGGFFYDANYRSAKVTFYVTAASATPPSAPTNLTTSIGYPQVDLDPSQTAALGASTIHRAFPIISWTPPSGSRLVNITVTGPSGLGTSTTPLGVYDILGTEGTTPSNSFYYGIPRITGSTGLNVPFNDLAFPKLLDGGTYTFTVKARNAFGESQSASVSVTMPTYPSVVRGSATGASFNAETQNSDLDYLGSASTQTDRNYFHPQPFVYQPPFGYSNDYYTSMNIPVWDVLDPTGVIIASETHPNGWTVTSSTSQTYIPQYLQATIDMYTADLYTTPKSATIPSTLITVKAPSTATLARRYFVRTGTWRKPEYSYTITFIGNKSAPFNVVGP